jgi:hypothetical protein
MSIVDSLEKRKEQAPLGIIPLALGVRLEGGVDYEVWSITTRTLVWWF